MGRAAARLRGAFSRVDAGRLAPPCRVSCGRDRTRGRRTACGRARQTYAEEPAPADAVAPSRRRRRRSRPVKKTFNFSNLKKVYWPAERYTKGDLIDYYRAVSPLAAAVSAQSPGGDDAVSRRHRREVVLSEGCAGVRAGLDSHGAASGARTRSGTSATSCATTRSRCSTSPTWDRSRCTFGRAASARSSLRLVRASISIRRKRRSRTSSAVRRCCTSSANRSGCPTM